MLKGCLKYIPASDDMPVAQWLEYLADDATDTLNYVHLTKRSLERERGNQ
jgi:hypothetical protein